MKTRNILFSAVLCLMCVACNNPNYDLRGMFNGTSPEVAERFSVSRHYSDSVGEIHLQMPNDYRLFVCTDTHIDTTHVALEKFIRAYKADTESHLAIHLGDLVNAKGYISHADSILHLDGVMSGVKDTLFIVCGNHDIYFNQWAEWQQYYGSSSYWFDTRNGSQLLDLYIGLDSAEGTLGTEQLKWLKALLEQKKNAGYRHVVVFSHTHLFKQDNSQGHTSNMSLEETYELTDLLSDYDVDLFLCGHDHYREVTDFGGVKYITVDACNDAEPEQHYMLLNMGDKYSYEFVKL